MESGTIANESVVEKREAETEPEVKSIKKRRVDTDPSQPLPRSSRRKPGDFRLIDDLGSAEYYIEDGLRKVKPYFFKYQAYAKGRWLGRKLLSVFTEEFRDRSEQYYKYAIEKGLITINDKPVNVDTIVRNQDIIGHQIHRHEPPVTDKDIVIVNQDKDLYVVDKPGGIPVHPAGRYRHNTVIHVLRKNHGIPILFPANRLDRLTSGLMLIALNAKRAQELEREMTAGKIRKEYVCRVQGEFPEGEIVCEAPIKTISFKLSLNYVHEDGKDCTTVFERLSYNGETSVVRCKPLTGRTHQIRVHLRYLGYPIANDPLYGNNTTWAPMLHAGKRMSEEESKSLVDSLLANSEYQDGDWQPVPEVPIPQPSSADDRKCDECSIALIADPVPNDLYIWLHAWRYSGQDWAYETELPEWAKDTFEQS
ncbi:pseudouridine synthase [Phycomyces nitens]|nr:pseudouridine synthase [Phycomyces nitens]